MSILDFARSVGGKFLTAKRASVAGLAIAGLYMFGGAATSYLSTASRLVSEGVHESLPLDFEIERAKTMMNGLLPEIKKNMISIAKEDAGVKTLRQEISRDQVILEKREAEIRALANLLKTSDQSSKEVLVNGRTVDREYANEQLTRIFERFKWDQDTAQQRMRLLDGQVASLEAAKLALEEKMNVKRDLEVELENLDARLFSLKRESVTSNITFDETKFSRCKELVQGLRTRLDVAEQLVAIGSPIEFGSTSQLFRNQDILEEIDEFFVDEPLQRVVVQIER